MIESRYSFKLLSQAKIAETYPDSKPITKEAESSEIDDKKRSFLKLAGVVGAGAVAASLIPKRAEALVFGSGSPAQSSVGVKNASNVRINPATEDTLAGIKSQSDLLSFDSVANTNPNAGNLMVNIAAGSVGLKNSGGSPINPATEDTLALIQAQTSKLSFTSDGSNLLKTTVSGSGSIVGLKDTTSTQINPATDESLVYLRRMVKLMESNATVDASNRQRITVDAFGTVPNSAGAATFGTGASGAGIPRVTISSDSTFNANVTTLNGWNDQMFQDVARTAYANGIRFNLQWT